MLSMDTCSEYIAVALGALASAGPRDLLAYLRQPGPDFEPAGPDDVDRMVDLLLSEDPNSGPRLRFSSLLRGWDNTKDAKWTQQTLRNTERRRLAICSLLKVDAPLAERINRVVPFFPLDEPLIIAADHTDCYSADDGSHYYWNVYKRYLKERRGWKDESLLSLENSTAEIVANLANPVLTTAYASRGLVMGYVQSGKTANFAGVIARAADAGYRLIIVLAGTWNILRNQTQRRLDKELLGKELLCNDESYRDSPPADWDEFLEHGFDPAERGHFIWQRLTRPEIDFRQLKAAIDNLEFERRNKSLPIYHPENLHALPAKLLVVKKHSGILKGLAKDLRLLRSHLQDVPALIIDDESDQAGLNTIDPKTAAAQKKERTETNKAVVTLLGLLPRGQYVGYTATPYANALVDPDDPEDLFPKDFIVSLDRPLGYMGVSDFFDPLADHTELDPADFSKPEIAFIRRVSASPEHDDEDLARAIRTYVLSGAVKLWRAANNGVRYPSHNFRHHTMLIHTSSRTGEHTSLAERVRQLWDSCAFNSPKGLREVERLWNEDFRPVCATQGDKTVPSAFAELRPHLAEAIAAILKDQHFIRVVNSDNKMSAPDFTAGPVWKIIVGGNKLSRGYTIEGLTVSYYRRVTNTGDTLMQMGRWFGFRPGYRDLVRVFLGVNEGRDGKTDLVSLFKQVCVMEERFREEIKRYARRPGSPRITPRQIPPLISIAGDLPPTSRNKMFNAAIVAKNYSAEWSMPTLTARSPEGMDVNLSALQSLVVAACTAPAEARLAGTKSDGDRITTKAVTFEVLNDDVVQFLSSYRWLETDYRSGERPTDIALQIEFLKKRQHGIRSWLILAPQRAESFGSPVVLAGTKFTVKERHRVDNRRFQVFGESSHRTLAEFLAGHSGHSSLVSWDAVTAALRVPNRGTVLLYPVRETPDVRVTVGFELFFPPNNLPYELHFGVIREAERDTVSIPVSRQFPVPLPAGHRALRGHQHRAARRR